MNKLFFLAYLIAALLFGSAIGCGMQGDKSVNILQEPYAVNFSVYATLVNQSIENNQVLKSARNALNLSAGGGTWLQRQAGIHQVTFEFEFARPTRLCTIYLQTWFKTVLAKTKIETKLRSDDVWEHRGYIPAVKTEAIHPEEIYIVPTGPPAKFLRMSFVSETHKAISHVWGIRRLQLTEDVATKSPTTSAPTEAPTEIPTTRSPTKLPTYLNCEAWCSNYDRSWKVKCNFIGCTGCPRCSATTPKPSARINGVEDLSDNEKSHNNVIVIIIGSSVGAIVIFGASFMLALYRRKKNIGFDHVDANTLDIASLSIFSRSAKSGGKRLRKRGSSTYAAISDMNASPETVTIRNSNWLV